jgi:DNA modification methylase
MKPVELVTRCLRNSSLRDEGVLDPFLGSGSSLIAAEHLGRTCYGMDIDPAYVDVAVKRWEDFTGRKAERVAGEQQ